METGGFDVRDSDSEKQTASRSPGPSPQVPDTRLCGLQKQLQDKNLQELQQTWLLPLRGNLLVLSLPEGQVLLGCPEDKSRQDLLQNKRSEVFHVEVSEIVLPVLQKIGCIPISISEGLQDKSILEYLSS